MYSTQANKLQKKHINHFSLHQQLTETCIFRSLVDLPSGFHPMKAPHALGVLPVHEGPRLISGYVVRVSQLFHYFLAMLSCHSHRMS